MNKRRKGAGGFFLDRAGVAAVEFALLSPVLLVILVGAVDLGGMLYTRFRLVGLVTAATSYAINNASSVSSSGGATLANSLAGLMANGQSASFANVSVVVNDGPSVAITGGTKTTGGTAAAADSCYCPTGTGRAVSWGAAVACGTSCASGGAAGKFVMLIASRSYVPIFSSYGIGSGNAISAAILAETQ